jgi:hypothetical protein
MTILQKGHAMNLEESEDCLVSMGWEEALKVNHYDFAYSPEGGGINREGEGETYTVMNGDAKAAEAGKWDQVQRTGLSLEEIPAALEALNIPSIDWSYE